MIELNNLITSLESVVKEYEAGNKVALVNDSLLSDEEKKVSDLVNQIIKNLERENDNKDLRIKVINDSVSSGLWQMEIDENMNVAKVIWSDDFRHMFNYAAALFITGQYQKAKTIFEAIVGRYPDCEEAEYGIICCDAKSGNKNTCLKKLNALKNKLLKKELTEIDEYRIAIVYYELEEYEGFSQVFDNKADKWWLRDMWEYFYVLHAQGRNVDFDNLVNAELTKIQEDLYAYQTDEINEDYTKEEQKEYIEQAKKEINELKKMTSKIRNTGYRPEVELKIYPRYGCYLIDCIRHQKIDYLC